MFSSYVDQFGQDISFDKNGDPPAWYDILNFIGKKGFRHAGDFRQVRRSHVLNMTTEPIMFYDKTSKIPESVCSKPCGKGQRVRLDLLAFNYTLKLAAKKDNRMLLDL